MNEKEVLQMLAEVLEEHNNILQWLGTSLEKNNDVLMMLLNEQNPEQMEFVNYVHNVRHVFFNELNEDQVTELFNDFKGRNDAE